MRKRVAPEYHLDRLGGVREGKDTFLPLPVDRTIELRFELEEGCDIEIGDVAGARVKPVVFVPEALAAEFDRDDLRSAILNAGAVYCKAPIVHVVRTVVKRDERHEAGLTLEESVRVFADETGPAGVEAKIEFAVALAREADGEVTE